MEQVDAVVAELRRIGDDPRGTDTQPGSAGLADRKGAVPIPGAKNRSQAEQNAGSLGWRMSDEEVGHLDGAALFGKRGISQRVWQHG